MFIHKNKKQKAVEQDFVQAGLCFLTFGYNGKKYTFQISLLLHYKYIVIFVDMFVRLISID